MKMMIIKKKGGQIQLKRSLTSLLWSILQSVCSPRVAIHHTKPIASTTKIKKGQNQNLILEQNRTLKSQVFLVHLSILIAIFCLVTFSHSFNYKTNFWTRQGFPWYSGICWLWQLCLLSFCGTNLLKQTKIKTEGDIQQMNPMPHSSHQSNPMSNTKLYSVFCLPLSSSSRPWYLCWSSRQFTHPSTINIWIQILKLPSCHP